MPLFEIGYRRYEGERTHERMRWWPIARHGWTLAWRAKLLRRLLLVSELPILYFAPLFFFIGRLTDPDIALPGGAGRDLAEAFFGNELIARLRTDPTAVRTAVWAIAFTFFTTLIQLIVSVLVASVAGPPLISQDLRTKAFLLYFSRPISSVDYLIGKAVSLGGLLAAVTLVPSLVLYSLSIAFSPSLETILHTLPVLLDVAQAALVLIVPLTLVVLTLSSLTKQARFAAIAWAVVCGFGVLFHQAITATRELRNASWPLLTSLIETVREAQLSIYDIPGRVDAIPGAPLMRNFKQFYAHQHGTTALLFLAALSAICWLVLVRRVSAPTRI
jgi:ABC-2 type transport system permease protein